MTNFPVSRLPTGCFDKNGKEIYQGDIILINDVTDGKVKKVVVHGFKEWGVFFYNEQPFKYLTSIGTPFTNTTEIIGNIYETV